jgi:hypothetical protein
MPDVAFRHRVGRTILNPPANIELGRYYGLNRSKECNMPAPDSLFCFTSNKIDSHPCPNCRAPMLVRINSAGPDLSVRRFECFNCDKVVVISGDRSKLSL